MNIKSNKKSDEPSALKQVSNGISKLVKGKFAPTIIFIAFTTASYFVWDYSGLISVFLNTIGFLFLITYKSNIEDKLVAIVLLFIVMIFLSHANVYNSDSRMIPAEYSKIEFTDSTEKMVIFMTKPVKEVLVLHLSDKSYYNAKDIGKDFNVTIQERTIGDHMGKLMGNGKEIEEWNYILTVKAKDFNYKNGGWKTSEKQLYKD